MQGPHFVRGVVLGLAVHPLRHAQARAGRGVVHRAAGEPPHEPCYSSNDDDALPALGLDLAFVPSCALVAQTALSGHAHMYSFGMLQMSLLADPLAFVPKYGVCSSSFKP
jgi:hypothetical protein